MARQIVVHTAGGSIHITEVLADNEAQLQEQLMTHPELVKAGERQPRAIARRQPGRVS